MSTEDIRSRLLCKIHQDNRDKISVWKITEPRNGPWEWDMDSKFFSFIKVKGTYRQAVDYALQQPWFLIDDRYEGSIDESREDVIVDLTK